jgi:hypothetical protein
MKPASQEAACRLKKAIFGTSGGKMVVETKKEVAADTTTP